MGDENTPTGQRESVQTDGSRVLSAEHRLRGMTDPGRRRETKLESTRHRKRIFRDVLVLTAVMLTAAAIHLFADVPNPDYPEAADIAHRLQTAWRSVALDEVEADDAAAGQGLVVYFFELDDGRVRTVYTHPEPTETGYCYAVRRGPDIATEAGILGDPGPGCTPQPPGVFTESGSWEAILPSERMTTAWYVPAMILLSVVALYALTDIPLAAITKSR